MSTYICLWLYVYYIIYVYYVSAIKNWIEITITITYVCIMVNDLICMWFMWFMYTCIYSCLYVAGRLHHPKAQHQIACSMRPQLLDLQQWCLSHQEMVNLYVFIYIYMNLYVLVQNNIYIYMRCIITLWNILEYHRILCVIIYIYIIALYYTYIYIYIIYISDNTYVYRYRYIYIYHSILQRPLRVWTSWTQQQPRTSVRSSVG